MTKYFFYETPENAIILFALQKNSNRKIALNQQLVLNQYTFSKYQWENADAVSFNDFFSNSAENCLSCPFAGAKGKCYTRKFHQWMAFNKHIKNAKQTAQPFSWSAVIKAAKQSTYLRFGVYGEPVLLPIDKIASLVDAQPNYTAYTHAWKTYPEYAKYFLASCDNLSETLYAQSLGWKTYTAINDKTDLNGMEKSFVNCPASKEAGYKTVCSICGLCRATKKSKSIFIHFH